MQIHMDILGVWISLGVKHDTNMRMKTNDTNRNQARCKYANEYESTNRMQMGKQDTNMRLG